MGFLDKLLGRGKKAAGDTMGGSSMREEMHHEHKGMAEESAAGHEEAAQEEHEGAAEQHGEHDETK